MVYSVYNSEVGGRTLFRLLAKDAGGETEEQLLKETVPPWVLNVIVFVSIQECGASVLWYGTEWEDDCKDLRRAAEREMDPRGINCLQGPLQIPASFSVCHVCLLYTPFSQLVKKIS